MSHIQLNMLIMFIKRCENVCSMLNYCCCMFQTQMSGDRAGSQCGLTSLLPMSCGRRAAAFARDLHSRLSNLGGAHDDHCENSWLTRDNTASHRPTTSNNQRELDTFYDFELECESPSSPVDDYEPAFPERSPTEDQDQPFYDIDSEPELSKEQNKLVQPADKPKNGFTFSTAFYTDCSPVKLQPIPRENGHASDKRLYSAITFEGCARQNSFDEVDCAAKPITALDTDRFSLPSFQCATLDSDSEFESAKSDPSDVVEVEEDFRNERITQVSAPEFLENLSLSEVEIPLDEEGPAETSPPIISELEAVVCNELSKKPLEIITSDVPIDAELSPAPEIEPSLLSAEVEDTGDKQNDTEIEDDRPQRVRRCSSLKTGKTPPGTPGRKKIVRFADVLGLDLADVKTFMDEIPVIPKSAYDDLTGCDVQSSPPVKSQPRLGALTLVPLFQLPAEITDKLETQNVCLESARVCDGVHVTVCGSVRVRNLDFHKTVHIRYTMNRWKTYTDLQATYVQGSCDGFSDRFQFVLYAPAISSGQRLELAVRFLCKGQQFWDSNSGGNYCFDCLALGIVQQPGSGAAAGPLHPTVDWHPSFY